MSFHSNSTQPPIPHHFPPSPAQRPGRPFSDTLPGAQNIDVQPSAEFGGQSEIREKPSTYPGLVECRATRETFSERVDSYIDNNRHELFLLGEGEKKVTWVEDSRKFLSYTLVELRNVKLIDVHCRCP